MDKQDALDLIAAVRSGEFEDATIEVKRARRGLPQRLYEALSAFANRPTGGVVVLGLDEAQQFAVTGVEDVQTVLTELTTLSARMMPPIALDVAVVEVEEQRILVAEVPECDYLYKPCYYAPSGLQSGAFLRVGNENRRMTEYEIFSYVTGRGQPLFDRALMPQATLDDLNPDLLSAYLARVKQQRGSVWRRLRLDNKTQVEQLLALEIMGQDDQGVYPTLAGLLVFGLWPQRLYPALMITFVRYPGVEAGGKGPRGERFLDNAQFEGALPEMIEQAVQRCLLNMRQSTLIEGIFHRSLPEYPEEALREALVNAVVHRDYSPFVVGSQVRIEMYDDRLEIQSPGGLFGPVNESNLQQAQSTRNQLLMRLLGEIGLVENRGSGIRAMLAALHEAHLEPPRFQDTRSYFRVIFSNHTLLDPATVTWLNRFAGLPLHRRQRTALAYLYRHEQMTNGDYCRLNNVDPGLATRELRGLVENGVVAMQGSRRWAYYTLTVTPQTEKQSPGLLWQGYDLNPRQQAALAFLQEHGTITTAQYVALTDVTISEQMARRDLRTLIQLGLIRRIGQARSTQYVLADAG